MEPICRIVRHRHDAREHEDGGFNRRTPNQRRDASILRDMSSKRWGACRPFNREKRRYATPKPGLIVSLMTRDSRAPCPPDAFVSGRFVLSADCVLAIVGIGIAAFAWSAG